MVEYAVGRKRILIRLIWAEFCRWRAVYYLLRDNRFLHVEPPGKRVDLFFVQVANYSQRTAHIAIHGAVAHSGFALIGGVQQHVSQLVGDPHKQQCAHPSLYVLLGSIGRHRAKYGR